MLIYSEGNKVYLFPSLFFRIKNLSDKRREQLSRADGTHRASHADILSAPKWPENKQKMAI